MNRKVVMILISGMLLLTGCSKRNEVMTAQENSAVNEDFVLTEQEKIESASQKNSQIYVYVCGYVEQPGVYALETGSRIFDALERAGGVTEEGKPEALNQAEPLEDGQTIYVPGLYEETESADIEDGLIDINKADKAILMTLPGIGEAKADIIIQYREEHGEFKSIEDLMEIPGIKKGVFDKIKDSIKVS